ncbi:hypothetical protein M9Y10_002685 [Tritrichomonas musculus]|uniref:Uncharacterized protein n=1 Tax=Tritrichomonas musculus TaxID=1915356 RepID=A0ABR2LAH8_9EUKA
MNAEENDSFKIVVIGDSGAGKTSVIFRYAKDFFDPSYGTTIGTSFIVKKLTDYHATLNIWDTAGQERYRSMVPMYCHGASAILIVFDVSSQSNSSASEFGDFINSNGIISSQNVLSDSINLNSATNLNTSSPQNSTNNNPENIAPNYQEVIDRWLSYVQQTVGDTVPIFIAGNKIDLVNDEETVVNQFKISSNGNLVESNNYPVFLVSAKTGKNINALFELIATQLIGNSKIKNDKSINALTNSNDVQVNKCC